MNKTAARLAKLLQHHERMAESLRNTIQLLNGTEPKIGKYGIPEAWVNGFHPAQTAAVKLDQARRKRRKPMSQSRSMIRLQRERSAKILAGFDTVKPKELPQQSLGSLVRRGYLIAKGDGYVRTSKPYEVTPRKIRD